MIRFMLDAAPEETAQGPSTLIMLAIFAVFIIFWYVIALRPQRKKEKELKAKVDSMRVGDRIITIGGLCGYVANIKDDEVTIMTSAANTLVTFKKSAINNVVGRDEHKANAEKTEKTEKIESKESSKEAAPEAAATEEETTTSEE
ncbi:MAG: preprotein translocase subunit YajC [Clostridiales bacterium]|nr:preprotein translocase subunit YajC [Clostridiales bacterium]